MNADHMVAALTDRIREIIPSDFTSILVIGPRIPFDLKAAEESYNRQLDPPGMGPRFSVEAKTGTSISPQRMMDDIRVMFSNGTSIALRIRQSFEAREQQPSPKLMADEFESFLLDVAIRAFEDVQDFVAESTTEPWPNVGPGRMPKIEGCVENNEIRVWFGDRERPVLKVRPIEILAG